MSILLRQQAKNSPHRAGVYLFSHGKKILYVGKAANLKKRLASYFRKNLSPKIRELMNEVDNLKWIETESEIDALIKEAELIKKYHPKYNILMRDDKNYFYVGITKEKFPKIFITHQLFQKFQHSAFRIRNSVKYIGPFTSGVAIKSVLKLLRKIFPYCTCNQLHKRPCLNAEIGRCQGYCCIQPVKHSKILENVRMLKTQNEYQKNINNIIAVLQGRKKGLTLKLRQSMKGASKKQEFERAAKIRDQIFGLENIFLHGKFLEVKPTAGGSIYAWRKIEQNLRGLLKIKNYISRVEGYDISNISGKEATGSMVVFTDGKPTKNEYKKFKIKTVNQISDVDMLKEVLKRRFKHSEWQMPDLILIDGGKPQLNAAKTALGGSAGNGAFVTSLAKREEELYIENRQWPVKLSDLPQETAFFLQRVRDESHRFAKKYHHKLRKLAFKNAKEY